MGSMIKSIVNYLPDDFGHFKEYGGKYVPETIIPAIRELEEVYKSVKEDKDFQADFNHLLSEYSGRPTPLYHARRVSSELGFNVFLKREDLNHTGAHKINNAVGQILLAQRMGKKRIIAETGAGQHGVATATVAAQFGLDCVIYMGEEDTRRQELNVFRMELLGAEVRTVSSGSKTLKDAINEAIRDWVSHIETTYYLIGSTVGPHPYPMIVRDFQSIIGKETKTQFAEITGDPALPDVLIACVGGGSNALGLFYPFLQDNVRMVGIEAAGLGLNSGKHAATITKGSFGVLHGSASLVLQSDEGQINLPHSISAGLDYPGVGPEHSYLKSIGRVEYFTATDKEAVSAFLWLSEKEGILPALESAHALSFLRIKDKKIKKGNNVVICLSGRGDKDVRTVSEFVKEKK